MECLNNNQDNTTASSSLSQGDSTKTYYTPYKFNFEDETDLINLENQIKQNKCLKDEILSVDDVLIFEQLRDSKCVILEKKYPNIYRWANELERMKRNWRISKRKNKGATFAEFIKNKEDLIRNEQKNEEKNLISGLSINADKLNNIHNSPSSNCKHNSKINTTPPKSIKKLKEYSIEIGVKFKPNIYKNWSEISSNLSIICQVYLPRGTEIKPIKDKNTGELFAIISSWTHKENYDISYIEQDIKRNIISVESVNIIDIKEIKENKNDDNKNSSITPFTSFI
jgi:hypothetical protein